MQNPPPDISNWQTALAASFQDLAQLCAYLQISPTDLPGTINDFAAFPLKVPHSYAACIEKGNPNDPLLLQVLPQTAELTTSAGYSSDPVGDMAALAGAGIIHKYQNRVLIIATGSCAINCRYCFRRHFPYTEVQLTKSRLDSMLTYINSHTEVNEVILSGGDPLLLSDQRLEQLLIAIGEIPHIKRLRIHSRLPVVLPERISPTLLSICRHSPKKVVMVLHSNHANELSLAVAKACQQLAQAGVLLLNQAVLLKGVNNEAYTLKNLSERLFAIGVMPYYLHLLDKTNGTHHFEISQESAIGIYQQLLAMLPGYLVPKLVTEQAGAAYKIPLYQT